MVVEVRADEDIAVLGLAATPVVGMRRGLIFDLERVAQAIKDAVNRANSMAGTTLAKAALAVGGEQMETVARSAEVAINEKTVQEEDVRAALAEAGRVALPKGHEVIQVIQRGVEVDGFRGVVDPVGMVAHRLGVEALVVSGRATGLKNLRRALSLCGLTAEYLVPAPRASAEGVLSSDERQVGVVLLDIGGGTTGVAVYQGGHLRHLGVVPLGGEAITSDLSVGLGVVVTQAERIKLEHAAVGQPREGTVEVRAVSGQTVKLIPMKEVAEIVQARVDEWFGFVEAQLARVEWTKGPAAGVVLTGGGALMKGLAGEIERRWQWPVRLGAPIGLGGLSDLARGPGYATVAGVARLAAQEAAGVGGEKFFDRILGAWMGLWR